EGTRRALEEHESYGRGAGPIEPRGVMTAVRGGRTTAIVWHSDSHVITLRAVGGADRPAWAVEISSEAPPDESERAIAAIGAAWSHHDSEEDAAQLDALAEALGQDRAWLEARGAEQFTRTGWRGDPPPF